VSSITSLAAYRKRTAAGWHDHIAQARADRAAETVQPQDARPPVRSVPLTDAQLLAVWQDAAARGVPGAEARVAALAKRLQP
jgi:hypothetical protein